MTFAQHYHFPGKYDPFDAQRETFEDLVRHSQWFVFNDIGTGKTLSLAWAADFLMTHGKIKKTLVASTLSTLWCVWEKTLYETFPTRSCTVLHGSRERRLKRLNEDHDFYIINHDGLKMLEAEINDRPDINHIIIDEGAELRNRRTQLWDATKSIQTRGKGDRSPRKRGIWWATGSPMPNKPTDIWAQCRIVTPHKVPKYFSHFRRLVMTQINITKWVANDGCDAYIYDLLKDVSTRFTRDQCIDLPPCVMEERHCDQSAEQSKAYTEMMRHLVVEAAEGRITAANEGVKRMKLLQIACGAVYTQDGKPQLLNPKHRLKVLYEVVRESGRKLLVFAPYKHIVHLVARALKKQGYSVGVITGDVSATKRNKIFQAFQFGDLEVIVAHPQTMAHGITLTRSHTVVWWTLIDRYDIFEQANGRIVRVGQTCKQTIIILLGTQVEREVYKRLRAKESMQGLILDLLRDTRVSLRKAS